MGCGVDALDMLGRMGSDKKVWHVAILLTAKLEVLDSTDLLGVSVPRKCLFQ